MKLFTNEQDGRHDESIFQIIKALGEIGATAKKILSQMEIQAASKTELISLTPNAFKPYRSDNFTFSSLFVSDAQVTDSIKLVVKVDGLQYTKTLAAGENIVNIPDASEISISNTSGLGQSIILVRYNKDKI